MADWESPKAFLARLGNAALRVAAMVLFICLHALIARALPLIVPENFKPALIWMQDVAFPFFALVYVYLLWDMVKVFVPKLNPKKYPGTEAQNEAEE